MADLSPEKISNVEADCYWCLSKLLDGMQDHYTFAQPGIQRLVFKLKELVRRIDGMSSIIDILKLKNIEVLSYIHTGGCIFYIFSLIDNHNS